MSNRFQRQQPTNDLLQWNFAKIFRLGVEDGDAVLLAHGGLIGLRGSWTRKTHYSEALATIIYTGDWDAVEARVLRRKTLVAMRGAGPENISLHSLQESAAPLPNDCPRVSGGLDSAYGNALRMRGVEVCGAGLAWKGVLISLISILGCPTQGI